MRNIIGLISVFSIVNVSILILGCGGTKEPLKYEPPKTPEQEEPVEEEPSEVQLKSEEPLEKEMIKKEVVILQMIHFDFDKSDLTPEARAILFENARKLEENPELVIRIEGHCDERGTVEYNLALGERRALAARNYLVNYGIDSNRITIISYGKERPLDPNHTLEAWAKNRRAEFIILN